MFIRILIATLCIVTSTISAHAAKVCAWMVETQSPDNERLLAIWLQSDARIDFYYVIGGRGIVTSNQTGNSPNEGTYNLTPGTADSPWKYGQAFEPPGSIDVTIELQKMPADIFSEAPKPLLAKFAFKRNVPASEKKPPATLAKKQCATISGY